MAGRIVDMVGMRMGRMDCEVGLMGCEDVVDVGRFGWWLKGSVGWWD